MKLQKPMIVGGGIAFILWLLTRDADASDDNFSSTFGEETSLGVTPLDEIHSLDLGMVEADVAGFDTDTDAEILGATALYGDGSCGKKVDGFGNSVSCLEYDKRLLSSYGTGKIGSEANG